MDESTESNDGPDWPGPRRDREQEEEIGRQVRIMFSAGKTVDQVRHWLIENGFTPEQAREYLAASAETEKSSRVVWIGGAAGAAIGVVASVALTCIYQPWRVAWLDALTGHPIDPLRAIVHHWCMGLAAMTIICGVVGTIYGVVVDGFRQRRRRP